MLIHNADITGSLTINGIPFNSGSFSGSFRGDGSQLTGITGATTASYVEYSNVGNKPALVSSSAQITYSGLSGIPSGIVSGSSQVSFTGIVDKPTLVSGSSQVTYGGLSGIPVGIVSGSSQVSFNGIVDKPTLVSGSAQISYPDLSNIPNGIVSSSTQITGYNIFATTGSNTFNGTQTITGSIFGTGSLTIDGCITATGQIVAQTINVQQVTSSIVYSCGSNIFGTSINNTQTLCGNIFATGSLACFAGQVCSNTLSTAGTVNISGVLNGTTACFGNTGTGNNVLLISNNDQSNTRLRITNIGSGGRTYSIVGGLNGANNSSLSIYDETASSTRLEINSAGIACFACQVCAPQFRANVGGCGCIAFFSTNGNIVFDNASISAIGNMGSNASQFSVSSRGCLTFRVGENGDPAAAPLRLLMDTNGIACFACQVCAPTAIFSGCVGIGTTSPYAKLSIVQDITTTAEFGSFGQFTIQGATNVAKLLSFGFNTATDVGFIQAMINGTSYNNLLLNARGGNVGIGTTAPNTRLDVRICDATAYATTCSGNALTLYNVSTTTNAFVGIDFLGEPTAGNAGRASINMITVGSGNGDLTFGTRSSSVFGERMRITAGGNVGIGTTCPTRALTVSGKAQLTSTSSTNELYLADACTSIIDNQWIGSIGNNITIGAGGFHRMNISSTGIACFACQVCAPSVLFNTAGTSGLFNTNITSIADFNASSRSGFTGLVNNCNGVYFGMGAENSGISAGIGFFRESVGWNSALAFYTNCVTDGVTVPRIQEKMRITSGGNVGIGVDPGITAKFRVEGTIYSNVRSNTIDTDDGVSNNFQGYGGYWALRTDTNNNFNLDVYGNGTPKNALSISQVSGEATFSSNIRLNCSTGLQQISSARLFTANTTTYYNTGIGQGGMLIVNSSVDRAAVFVVSAPGAGNSAISEIGDPSSCYSTTCNNANTVNFFFSGGSGNLLLQNCTGSTRDFSLTLIGTP